MNNTAAVSAVVVAMLLTGACRKKQRSGDPPIESVEVAPAPLVTPLPPPEPRPIGALLLEAQRRAGGLSTSWVKIDFVGPDGVMDPAIAKLDVAYGTSGGAGPADDPRRKTGAPATCPRLTWEQGRWKTQLTTCPDRVMTLQCTVAVLWNKAIAVGAPRDAVAKLSVSAPPSSSSPPTWRFDLDDAVRNVHFHETFPDDCGPIAEAPDPAFAPVPAGRDDLDQRTIANAIGVARPKIAACGDATPSARGVVKVYVKVRPDGTVESADIRTTPDKGLGECVQTAVRSAMFPATKQGGSFSYPFVF